MDSIKLMGFLLPFLYDPVISSLHDSFDYVPNAAIVIEHNTEIMNTMIPNMNMRTCAQEVSRSWVHNYAVPYLWNAL